MKARYIALYRLPGISKLPPGVSCCQLAAFSHPRLSATLVSDPAPYFEHIDKLGGLLMTLFKGVGATDTSVSLEQRLAAEIASARRQREAASGTDPIIVFDCETDISVEAIENRQEIGNVVFCINSVPRGVVRGKFQGAIESVIVAVILSIPAIADQRIETMGSVVILIDGSSGQSIYPVGIVGNPVVISRAASISPEVIVKAAEFSNRINSKKALTSSIRLLFASLGSQSEDPNAFVMAWAALEQFVNSVYKQKLVAQRAGAGKRMSSIASQGRPSSSDTPAARGLVEKFSAIARSYDPMIPEDEICRDIKCFHFLNASRNSFYHSGGENRSDLPVKDIQDILRKYLGLYFDAHE